MMLADMARVENGKLYILGGGWDHLRGNSPFSFAVAALIEIPMDGQVVELQGDITLVDSDGRIWSAPDGSQIHVEFMIRAEQNDPNAMSQWLQIPQAFNFNQVVLPIGRYSWRLTVGDGMATKSFSVTA